jgi:hypothetical protein
VVIRLHLLPALVVPEHWTLVLELLLEPEVLVSSVLANFAGATDEDGALLPVPGLQTLHAVNPSA